MTPEQPTPATDALPDPITVPCGASRLDELLSKEWLLTNRLGAYSSSTVIGCNTRRYHALLVASLTPPVGRVVVLSTLMEQLSVGHATWELATNEFDEAFSPRGLVHLDSCQAGPATVFLYRMGEVELRKEVVLAEQANAVAIRYRLAGGKATLRLRPFTALRDFHRLRSVKGSQLTWESARGGILVRDTSWPDAALHMLTDRGDWEGDGQWWYDFLYRQDLTRGQDSHEDLYSPGQFTCTLGDGESLQVTASLNEPDSLDVATEIQQRRTRLAHLAEAVGSEADEPTRRLATATDAFVVDRHVANGPALSTIVAGYHWFADWGRDAFIALPGLLLSTKRYEKAREVFRTFADHIGDGMIPNRFDDYSHSAHYNSIDASLWFIIAAERYVRETGDTEFWRGVLQPAAVQIVRSYRDGTRFGIRADADGLVAGGDRQTQLTWMDAKLGEEVVTPRHGKPVEVNAMWHAAHRILADRCAAVDRAMAEEFAADADRIAGAFRETFWNESVGHLNDCITDGSPDASLRPNQILAVSLPYSPLPVEQQRQVVSRVGELLRTPVGLRSLSPFDPRYRRRYGGSWESRDRSYHQGTVWGWLAGPYVEAVLNAAEDKAAAAADMADYLGNFDDHLHHAGLGQISEIFDGDAPHYPRGCIAQAWSVAEVLRARLLVHRVQQEAE